LIDVHVEANFQLLDVRYNLDLKELFVYKLLERIGVGAKIEFLTNGCGSRWIIYIVNKKIDNNFKTIELLNKCTRRIRAREQ
jgi:hypothetical protein